MQNEVTMETIFMLSTIDNPYNPFDDFLSWRMFDISEGYFSCERLDRLTIFSDDMTQKEINEETERAIDAFIEAEPLGIFIKVSKEVPVEEI